jgi:hypothetical protein
MDFELRASHFAKQVLYHLSHTSNPFCSGYFGGEVLQTICSGWSQTKILLISVSQVARITGMSHWHLAVNFIFDRWYNYSSYILS